MLNKESVMALTLPTSVRVLLPSGQVDEMKLETYLAGVVAAEIGAAAPLEALKAQAVASRTYVASAQRHQEYGADVCTSAHCQKWKRVDPVSAPEIFRALSETWGIVATHDGKLINAFFFEHCDGRTRSAEDMLMPALPYLRAVDCSCGFLSLKGHGVGMCKRGASMMARHGASFEQILRHYYRGIVVTNTARENHAAPELEVAEPTPTAKPAKSSAPSPRARGKRAKGPVITEPKPVGVEREQPAPRVPPRPPIPPAPRQTLPPSPVVPLPAPLPVPQTPRPPKKQVTPSVETPPVGIEPAVSTPTESLRAKASEPTGSVPAGTAKPADVKVSGSEVKVTEGSAQVVVPKLAVESHQTRVEQAHVKPAPRVHVDHLPGQRMIAGCLPRGGIVVSIEDARGNKTLVFSGSAAHYGEGGFETVVEEDGRYRVSIGDQVIEVDLRGETVFIHVA